ncbi:MAG TPA: GNAT family N-acetyltransferase [Fluviicola sp.]|nr:GNAT family N-acetyltransferase [Fluviicola sp.]
MDYEIRRLSKENISDVARIHQSVYKRKLPQETLHRKYEPRYSGIGYCGYLAYFNSEPVAFYGLIPMESHCGTTTEISAQSADAMTIAAHRGKGLFGLLGNKTCELAKELGITFVWAFATDVSKGPVMGKVGYRCDEHLVGYRFFARKRWLDKLPFLRSAVESRARNILRQYATDKPFRGSLYHLADNPIITRNADYFRCKNPGGSFFIELQEVLFWIKLHPHHGIMIGDMEADSETQIRAGMLAFKTLANRHGLGTLIFQTSPGTPIANIVTELADETFQSWALCYRSLGSEFPLEKFKATWGDLDTF